MDSIMKQLQQARLYAWRYRHITQWKGSAVRTKRHIFSTEEVKLWVGKRRIQSAKEGKGRQIT